jgi:solute carrier family 13 (sodium-dependent dicarboxylate transporter), member 2/3/5
MKSSARLRLLRRLGLGVLGPIVFFVIKSFLVSAAFPLSMSVVMATLGWMLVWWVLSPLPVAVPALLPFVVFPFYGVLPPTELAASVGASTIFLFLGGFMLSAAIEKWELHRDFAGFLLRRSSGTLASLLGIFIFVSAFASMWISNTATVLILLPVIDALFPRLEGESDHDRAWLGDLMLATAYASSIGGIATIIGSPPNAIAVGFLKQKGLTSIGFAEWMKLGLPLAVLGCFILYGVFRFLLRGRSVTDLSARVKRSLEALHSTRGHARFEKASVLLILVSCVLLWFSVPYLNAAQWPVSDSMVAVGAGILLFAWPSRTSPGEALLGARDLDRLPWATLFLFAGGLALSKALQSSGWIEWSEQYLSGLSSWSTGGLILLLAGVAILLTEVMSNTALAALIVPWALGFSNIIDLPLHHLVLALCFASSLSFMMPVATPPNALAFSRGYIRFGRMLRVGFVLNVIFALVLSAYVIWVLPLLG